MARSSNKPVRHKIIEAITAPLGFYVLALLIVESFLAIAMTVATRELECDSALSVVFIGVGMFVLVVSVVSVLVWFKPANLTFDKEAHLRRSKMPWGSKDRMQGDPNSLPAKKATEEGVEPT